MESINYLQMNIKNIGIFIISVITFTSCKKNSEELDQPVDPVNKTSQHFQFNSRKINLFQRISSSGSPVNMKSSELPTYFGDRISYFFPQEILIKNDSTTIVKLHGLTEKFKSKWDKNDLYYQVGNSDNWKLLGSKSGSSGFQVIAGFYTKRTSSSSSGSMISGQQYNLKSYESLINKDENKASLIWLSAESFYEQVSSNK